RPGPSRRRYMSSPLVGALFQRPDALGDLPRGVRREVREFLALGPEVLPLVLAFLVHDLIRLDGGQLQRLGPPVLTIARDGLNQRRAVVLPARDNGLERVVEGAVRGLVYRRRELPDRHQASFRQPRIQSGPSHPVNARVPLTNT